MKNRRFIPLLLALCLLCAAALPAPARAAADQQMKLTSSQATGGFPRDHIGENGRALILQRTTGTTTAQVTAEVSDLPSADPEILYKIVWSLSLNKDGTAALSGADLQTGKVTSTNLRRQADGTLNATVTLIGKERGEGTICAELYQMDDTDCVSRIDYTDAAFSINQLVTQLDLWPLTCVPSTSIAVDETISLRANISPDNANQGDSLRWESSAPSIVKLEDSDDGDGHVVTGPNSVQITGLAEGTAVITVSSPGGSAAPKSCTVTVTPRSGQWASVSLVTIKDRSVLEFEDPAHSASQQIEQLTAAVTTMTGLNESDWPITWTSSDTGVVEVNIHKPDKDKHEIETDRLADVVPVGPGEATITAAAGGKSTSCRVIVSGVAIYQDNKRVSDSIDEDKDGIPDTVKVKRGETISFTKRLFGKTTTLNTTWEWSSSSSAVRVDKTSGIVYGLQKTSKAGVPVTCSAKDGGWSNSVMVEVEDQDGVLIIPLTMSADTDRYNMNGAVPRMTSLAVNLLDANSLDYVTGLEVSASQGTLYYGYKDEPSTGAGVSTTDRLYISGGKASDKQLSRVDFIPKPGFSGTAIIHFIAYATVDGKSENFPGEIHLTVSGSSADGISYTSEAGKAVYFNSGDFTNVCKPKYGYPVSSVSFTPPAERYGFLYFEYSGGEVFGSNVSDSKRYYAGSDPSLDSVAFVPRAGYTGSFTIPYTAWDTAGNTFSGKIKITVKAADGPGSGSDEGSAAVISKSSTGMPVTFARSDFTAACRDVLPDELESVRISLPAASSGKLYENFRSLRDNKPLPANKDLPASALTGLVFVPRGNLSGSAHFSYTATDRAGNTCTGSARVYMSSPAASEYFNDMKSSPWAVSSVDFLKRYGVVEGTSSDHTNFSPTQNMRRCDFILMLVRAFDLPDVSGGSFADVPANSYYAKAMAAAKAKGIVKGSSTDKFRPTEGVTRQDAAVFLYRALQTAGRAPAGSDYDLASFTDRGYIAPYARDALAALVNAGVFQGNGSGKLLPTKVLSRAEMAAILHRAIT